MPPRFNLRERRREPRNDNLPERSWAERLLEDDLDSESDHDDENWSIFGSESEDEQSDSDYSTEKSESDHNEDEIENTSLQTRLLNARSQPGRPVSTIYGTETVGKQKYSWSLNKPSRISGKHDKFVAH